MTASASVIPVLLAAVVVFQPRMKSAPEANGSIEEQSLEISVSQCYGGVDPESAPEVPMEILDDAAYSAVVSALGGTEFIIRDTVVIEQIQQIIAKFSQQVAENTKRTDEIEEEYRIRLTDQNETIMYLARGDSLYDENDNLIGSNADAAEELITLIEKVK